MQRRRSLRSAAQRARRYIQSSDAERCGGKDDNSGPGTASSGGGRGSGSGSGPGDDERHGPLRLSTSWVAGDDERHTGVACRAGAHNASLREVTKAKALAALDTLKNPGFEAAMATKADADYAP